jgi:PAS domain S-box-containing protein
VKTETIRVLLVDDDIGDTQMTRAMLAQAGPEAFSLEWVSTYEEALDAFEAADFDACLVDYFLEDRTGLDLLREARRRGVSAPMIMLTGRGSQAVDEEAREVGAAAYLVKGQFDPAELAQTLISAVGTTEVTTAPDTSGSFGEADARFRAVFETSGSGIALLDLDGLILEANGAFAERLGAPASDLGGKPFLDLVPESDHPALLRELGALSRGETDRASSERVLQAKGRKDFPARTTASLVRDSAGAPNHLVVVLDW